MDLSIVQWINGFAGHSPTLDAVGIFLATGLIIPLAAVVACWLIRQPTLLRRHHAVAITVIVLLGYAIAQVIGLVAFRERPFVQHEIHMLIAKGVTEKSFPSDHATIAFSLAFAVLLSGARRWGSVFVALAVLIGLGRVFVGVHYPSDILGGAMLAYVVALVVRRWGMVTMARARNERSAP